MQFYINSIPNPGDYVLCKIKGFSDLGVKISLPEYDNKSGYIIYNNSSKKKKNEINKYYKIDKEIIVEYLGIFDSELSFTDKYLIEDKKKQFLNFYSEYSTIYKIIKSFMKLNNIDISFLNNSLYNINRLDVYDTYEYIIKDNNIDKLNIQDIELSTKFFDYIKKKVNINYYSYKLKYEIKSVKSFGINNIKDFFHELHITFPDINSYIYGIPFYIIETKVYNYKKDLLKDVEILKSNIILLSKKYDINIIINKEEIINIDLIDKK